MISVSTDIANAINASNRMWDVKLIKVSDSSEIQCDIKKLTIHKGACGTFSVGSIFVPYVEMELFGEVNITSEFKIRVGVYTGEDPLYPGVALFPSALLYPGPRRQFGYFDIGYFYPTSSKKGTATTEVVAQGRLSNMANEVLYSNLEATKTLAQIISDVVAKGYTITYKNGLTIPDASISTVWSNVTCRDALQIVATCVGGFVTEDNAGNICLCKFNPCTSANLNLDGDKTTQVPTYRGEYEVVGCKVIVDSETTFEEANANLVVTNPFFNSDMWNTYKANLTGLTFEVGSAPITLGDPRLEAWDCVKYTDNNNVHHYMPCFAVDFDYTGGLSMNIESDATLPDESAALLGGPVTRALEDMQLELEERPTADEVEEMIEDGNTYEAIEFLATTTTSTPSPSTIGSFTVPTLTSTYKYLWQRKVTYTGETRDYATWQRCTTMDGVVLFMNTVGEQDGSGNYTMINGGCIDTSNLYLGRISTDGQNYAEVNSDGLSVVKSGVPVASFGETVELNGDGSTLSFTNSQLKIEDEDGNEYFNMMFTQGGSMTESFSSMDFTLSGVYTSLTKVAVRLKRGNQIIYPYLECSIGSSTEGIFERSGFIYGTWSRSGSTFHIAIRSASGATFMNAYVVGVAQRGASLNIDGDIANQDGYCIANAVGAGRIMKWGSTTIEASGTSSVRGTVDFGYTFSATPYVFLQVVSSYQTNAVVDQVTATGARITIWDNSSGASGDRIVRWLAIGLA